MIKAKKGDIMKKRNKYDHYLPVTRNELERRITLLESKDYEYPPHLRKGDWIGFLIVEITCFAIICGLMLYCSAL